MRSRDFLSPQSPDADQMADRTEERLFSAVVSNKNHVLHSRLPVKRPRIYELRPRAHDYSLPPKYEQNFITRLLCLSSSSSLFSSVGCADDEALTRLFQTSFLFVFGRFTSPGSFGYFSPSGPP